MMLYVADLLYDGVSLALGSEEGPVAGRDGFVVLSYGHGHGAGEDVQGELLHPLVPVALVELCAVCRMSEESRPLTYFGSKGLIEGTMTSRSELLPDAEIPVVDLAVVLMLQVLLLTASTAGA